MPVIETPGPQHRPAILDAVANAFGRTDEAKLVSALIDGGYGAVERVAIRDSVVVGHILLSRVDAPEGCLALAPVSVRTAFHGTGIGSALIRNALSAASADGWSGVFVLGEPAYYERFGFSVAAAAEFPGPYPAE